VAQPSSPTQRDQIRAVMIEAARTEVAAVTAGISFWSGWVDAAEKYTAAISAELARLEADPTGTADLTGRLADLSRAYLRELTELPSATVKRFNTELEKVGTSKVKAQTQAPAKPAPRKRAARAKA
jgi:sirohydrochlorin ferrochelatase